MSLLAFWRKGLYRTSEPKLSIAKEGNPMKCTYCGGTSFLEGPSGGMSTNVLCANKDCRHWFNHTPLPGMELEDLHRVEPTQEEKEAAHQDREKQEVMNIAARHLEGAEAYNKGLSAKTLLTTARYGNYAEAGDNVDRLVGFMDAMAQQVRGRK